MTPFTSMVIIIQYYIEFRCPKIALIVLKGSNLQMVAFLGFLRSRSAEPFCGNLFRECQCRQ